MKSEVVTCFEKFKSGDRRAAQRHSLRKMAREKTGFRNLVSFVGVPA